jgi:hypothetical protein
MASFERRENWGALIFRVDCAAFGIGARPTVPTAKSLAGIFSGSWRLEA